MEQSCAGLRSASSASDPSAKNRRQRPSHTSLLKIHKAIAMATARKSVLKVMNSVAAATASCPCHSAVSTAGHLTRNTMQAARLASILQSGHSHHHHHHHHEHAPSGSRSYAAAVDQQPEYAFEMAASTIRFGEGVTREIGMDCINMGAKRVGVLTDATISKLLPMKQVVESLETHGVKYELYDNVRVEPTDVSFKQAIDWAKAKDIDLFIAVGGGSVIDTAKAANLYSSYPDADFLDFVNAPLGKGRPIEKKLFPLIAVPTTAGTGSETTGTAIFDYTPKDFKTGIANRALKPTIGIVDPLNTRTMPSQVHASSGLDVLCHALESYTAIPYYERVPRPSNPILRPAYQGRNPISDVFSIYALKQTAKYLPRAVADPDDHEAQSNMLLAATFAGIGFGNAGVHLPHGMSYAVSGLNKKLAKYAHPGYSVEGRPIVPHGVSVAVSAPAVFNFTAPSDPARHIEAAEIFGYKHSSTKPVTNEMAGEIIGEQLSKFLSDLPDMPRGLKAIGYKSGDVDLLVEGTLPQKRVLDLAPGDNTASREVLSRIFENAMTF